MLLVSVIAILTIGCSTTFKPDFCDIVNIDTLQCDPTDSAKDKYDLTTLEAIGYRCISPEDWAEGKKRVRQALELDP